MSSEPSSPAHETSRQSGFAFFDEVRAAFKEARRMAGGEERFFGIGGYTVGLHFAGDELPGRITPALEHLAIPATDSPDLCIELWDSESTGVEVPSPPWQWDDCVARNEIQDARFNNESLRTAFHLGSGVLSLLKLESNHALFWLRDARELPVYESGAPLLTILHWWMSTRSRQLLHAAAIGNPDGGVLLVGKGGSGKSSTALQSLESPLLYAADDYCLLSLENGPYLHSLYSSGKVCGHDTETFPFLAPALVGAPRLDNEKALFFLRDHFAPKITSGFPLKAILLPRVTGQPETRVVPCPASAALLALAPSTIFQLPGAGAAHFKMMSELVRQLPGYILELGTQRERIPEVIANLLAQT